MTFDWDFQSTKMVDEREREREREEEGTRSLA
jgi:hypothetical protein